MLKIIQVHGEAAPQIMANVSHRRPLQIAMQGIPIGRVCAVVDDPPRPRRWPETAQVSTLIGSSYNPTLYWRDDVSAVHYTRFDGKNWSDVRTIALSDSMSYDAALRLLEAMAARN